MRIRFFTDKTKAGAEYRAQVKSGNKCLLMGPCDLVTAPNSDGTSFYDYDAGGGGNIYVLAIGVPDTIASFDVPKVVPQAGGG